MSYTKKVVWSFGIIFLCLAGANLFGYLMRLLLARSLSVPEYGLIFAITGFFSFFAFAQTLGLTDALVHFIPRLKRNEVKSAFTSVLYLQLAVTSVIFLIALLIAKPLATHYFEDTIAAPLFILFGVAVLLSPIEMSLIALFQGLGKTTWYGYLMLVRAIGLFLIAAALLATGAGVFAAMLAYVLVYLLIPLIHLPLLRSAYPEYRKAKSAFNPALLRKFLIFGIPVILASSIGFFLTYVDIFFLTLYRSLAEVGLYNAALPTAGLLWFVSSVIYAVMFPISSEMHAKKRTTVLTDAIGKMYLYLLIILLPFAIILILYPTIILNLLFGSAYVGAARSLQLLALGGILYTLSNLNASIITGLGQPKKTLYALGAAAVVNVILDILLIPTYGIDGSALATLIAFIVLFTVNTAVLRSIIAFRIPYWRILGAFMAATGAAFVITASRNLPLGLWPKIIVGLLLSAVAYVVLLFALRIITFKELGDVRRLVR